MEKRKRGGSSSNTSSCRNQNYFDDVLISSDLMINVSQTITVMFFYAIDNHYNIDIPWLYYLTNTVYNISITLWKNSIIYKYGIKK